MKHFSEEEEGFLGDLGGTRTPNAPSHDKVAAEGRRRRVASARLAAVAMAAMAALAFIAVACRGASPFGVGGAIGTDPAAITYAEGVASGPRSLQWTSHPGKCFQVGGEGPHKGQLLELWDCNGSSPHQLFEWGPGVSQIWLAAHPYLCVDVAYHRFEPGQSVQLWDCLDGNRDQFFRTPDNGRGNFEVYAHPGMCLDVKRHIPSNGNGIQIWTCLDGPNQALAARFPEGAGMQTSTESTSGEAIEGWLPHYYTKWQTSAWCKWAGVQTDGYEYRWFGLKTPCGPSWCCKRPAKKAIVQSAEDKAEMQRRRGSFMMLGDWGFDEKLHFLSPACAHAITEVMLRWMRKLGDVKFMINVGDSFYPDGVHSKDDWQWQAKWRDVYHRELRSVPWYSVYGNHDYHHDPFLCGDDTHTGAQINPDEENLDYFVMPNYTYFKEVRELDMEIIGLDLNRYMDGWDKKRSLEDLKFTDCQWSPCQDREACLARMEARSNASFDLFYERQAKSPAKNLLVFSHYPTDYFTGYADDFLAALKDNSRHDIVYAGGHRHSTDNWSTEPISPNQNWLVGGGGGWSCDSKDQGFVVGEVLMDGTVKTYTVLVPRDVCCQVEEKAAI